MVALSSKMLWDSFLLVSMCFEHPGDSSIFGTKFLIRFTLKCGDVVYFPSSTFLPVLHGTLYTFKNGAWFYRPISNSIFFSHTFSDPLR